MKGSALVIKVEQPLAVRERLRAYGICAGARISLLKHSLFRKTFLVQAGPAKIALSREVAEGIWVKQI